MNSISMWCIYVSAVVHKMYHTHIVYLYGGVKPSSYQERVNAWNVSCWGQTTSCLVGQGKQGRYSMEESRQKAQSSSRTRPGWTHWWGASRNSRSSMYKVYVDRMLHLILKKKMGTLWTMYAIYMPDIRSFFCRPYDSLFVINCLIPVLSTWLILVPDVYFLCRLKINHDSHEFILEFGTVANKTYYFFIHILRM